jgi:hypothetical protein
LNNLNLQFRFQFTITTNFFVNAILKKITEASGKSWEVNLLPESFTTSASQRKRHRSQRPPRFAPPRANHRRKRGNFKIIDGYFEERRNKTKRQPRFRQRHAAASKNSRAERSDYIGESQRLNFQKASDEESFAGQRSANRAATRSLFRQTKFQNRR